MGQHKLQKMTVIALFAAIIGILAQIAIPLPIGVPITGQTFAIGLTATILGSRYGTYATMLYIAIGAVGIPVYAHLTSGFGIIVGPTGGFLVGFIPTVYVIGLYLEKTKFSVVHATIANIIGMFVTLICGTIWLKFSAELTWTVAFVSGFVPFIIVGIVKAFLAAWAGVIIRDRLMQANVLQRILSQ